MEYSSSYRADVKCLQKIMSYIAWPTDQVRYIPVV